MKLLNNNLKILSKWSSVHRGKQYLDFASPKGLAKSSALCCYFNLDTSRVKRKCNILKNKQGFTLVELILYVGISAFLLFVISLFLFLMIQSQIKNQTIAEVEEQGTRAMRLINDTTRNANKIILPATSTIGTSLTLQVASPTLSPTIFDLSGGKIRIKEGTALPIDLTNSRVTISNLSFHNLSKGGTKGTARVRFTISRVNPENRNEYSYSKTFYGSATIR